MGRQMKRVTSLHTARNNFADKSKLNLCHWWLVAVLTLGCQE